MYHNETMGETGARFEAIDRGLAVIQGNKPEAMDPATLYGLSIILEYLVAAGAIALTAAGIAKILSK